MRLALLFLAGCVSSDAGKTLVYALDEAPTGRIDRDLCAAGVGLNYALNLEDSLSYSVSPDGRDALLGTCSIVDGQVSQCFTLTPDAVLTIADDGDQNQAKDLEDSPDELSWDAEESAITEESALEAEDGWLTSPRPKIKTKISLTDLEFDE